MAIHSHLHCEMVDVNELQSTDNNMEKLTEQSLELSLEEDEDDEVANVDDRLSDGNDNNPLQ